MCCYARRLAKAAWLTRTAVRRYRQACAVGSSCSSPCCLAASLLGPRAAEARITKLVVTTVQSPTFGGTTFGIVGAYEKIAGRAFGEIDPNDPRNATITDLAFAPRNAAGKVEYSMDVYLLKPVDMTRASRKLFYEANNRGLKLATGVINTVDRLFLSNDPTSPADAGDGFLMRRGYVIAWSGWDVTVAPGPGALSITVPVATQPDGSPIVGPSLEEFVVDGPRRRTGCRIPRRTLDTGAASLSVRTHAEDPPVAIASQGWEYVDSADRPAPAAGHAIPAGEAVRPRVSGAGAAGRRSRVRGDARLPDVPPPRRGRRRRHGEPGRRRRGLRIRIRPVAAGALPARASSISASTRTRAVAWSSTGCSTSSAGPGGGSFNHRFAQPGRTIRQHRDRLYPEIRFPFTWAVMTDPVTGRTDGRLRRCLACGTCPKIFDVNSANEYWNKSASLLHTDAAGRDLADPPNVRFYLLSSLPHVASGGQGHLPAGAERAPAESRAPRVARRARRMGAGGKRPPASRVPRSAKGTLLPSLPQAKVALPRRFPASRTTVSRARATCSTSGRRWTRAC